MHFDKLTQMCNYHHNQDIEYLKVAKRVDLKISHHKTKGNYER